MSNDCNQTVITPFINAVEPRFTNTILNEHNIVLEKNNTFFYINLNKKNIFNLRIKNLV